MEDKIIHAAPNGVSDGHGGGNNGHNGTLDVNDVHSTPLDVNKRNDEAFNSHSNSGSESTSLSTSDSTSSSTSDAPEEDKLDMNPQPYDPIRHTSVDRPEGLVHPPIGAR